MVSEFLTQILTNITLDPELKVFILAMFPVTELRLSIPIGITIWNLSWKKAFIYSLMGNLLVSLPILRMIKPASEFLLLRCMSRFI